jgi:hypothetical protein
MQYQPTQAYQPTYLNVMEIFVAQEVERQMAHLPKVVQNYIQPETVITTALVGLPRLYTHLEKGWQYQYQLAKQNLQLKIVESVRQALVSARYETFARLSDHEKQLYLQDWQKSAAQSWGVGVFKMMI